jgi:hypothetical protein
MPECRVHDVRSGFLDKSQLQKLRLRAMRAGVWFRSLPRIDRVLVDLTIKVAGRVRRITLAENILAVVRKLEHIGRVTRTVEGQVLAGVQD